MIEIVGGLYLGNREAARDLHRLRLQRITHVVNCAVELPNYHEDDLNYLHLGLRDPDPLFQERIDGACAFIDAARDGGGRVLVHCYAAVSRSPAVVLAYLCHRGDTLEEAARRLGGIVWTDPGGSFLEQLARRSGAAYDDAARRRVDAALKGRG